MVLEKLLGTLAPSIFMQDYFLRLPFALPGGCRHLTALGSWETIERILPIPGADIFAGREGHGRDGPAPTTLAEARAVVASGYTLRLRHVERHDPGLAALAEDFRSDFQAPIDIQLYWTPADCPGFGWHYDPEDVFVLQMLGRKEWHLRKNTVNPWPLIETLPANMRYEREIMPLWRCNLTAGDWLYIPNGYWHRTRAGEESISLSVGVLSPAAVDVYDFLRMYLLGSLKWRQRLPPAGAGSHLSAEDLLHQYQQLFAGLGDDLAALLKREDIVRAFLKRSACLNDPR
jgi:50S ribosomal protein L16 3-hydroxylase